MPRHRKKGRVRHERGTRTTYPRSDFRKQQKDAKVIAESMEDAWTKDTVKIVTTALRNYGTIGRIGTNHE